jgi:hypothetical protein
LLRWGGSTSKASELDHDDLRVNKFSVARSSRLWKRIRIIRICWTLFTLEQGSEYRSWALS